MFNGITALSLLLVVAMAGLWARSHYYHDFLYSHGGSNGPNLTVATDAAGRLSFAISHGITLFPERFRWISYKNYANDSDPPGNWLGLSFYQGAGGHIDVRSVRLPYWIPVLILAVLPIARLYKRILGRTIAEEHCTRCGYDLRATPDRCPECGTIPPKKTETNVV
jgi:hypothetical protein